MLNSVCVPQANDTYFLHNSRKYPSHPSRLALPQALKTLIAPLHINRKQKLKPDPDLHPDEVYWGTASGCACVGPAQPGTGPARAVRRERRGDGGRPQPGAGANGWRQLPGHRRHGRRLRPSQRRCRFWAGRRR